MPKDTFEFQQFTVRQDQCAMKVGTDGVLVGAWAATLLPSVSTHYRLIDIGTGTGIIALIMAQHCAEQALQYHIDAIDIDEAAARQARQNFDMSPWAGQLTVYAQSLADFECQLTTGYPPAEVQYNLIVSNPPFYNATLKPDDPQRAIARHHDALPVAQIMDFAQRHLSPEGQLVLIYPVQADTEVMTQAALCRLHATHICDVLTKEGKPAKRRMTAFSHAPSALLRITLAILDAQGHYTEQYRQLTGHLYHHLSD